MLLGLYPWDVEFGRKNILIVGAWCVHKGCFSSVSLHFSLSSYLSPNFLFLCIFPLLFCKQRLHVGVFNLCFNVKINLCFSVKIKLAVTVGEVPCGSTVLKLLVMRLWLRSGVLSLPVTTRSPSTALSCALILFLWTSRHLALWPSVKILAYAHVCVCDTKEVTRCNPKLHPVIDFLKSNKCLRLQRL